MVYWSRYINHSLALNLLIITLASAAIRLNRRRGVVGQIYSIVLRRLMGSMIFISKKRPLVAHQPVENSGKFCQMQYHSCLNEYSLWEQHWVMMSFEIDIICHMHQLI